MAGRTSNSPKLVYLAQPYSHVSAEVMERRFRDGCRAAARIMSAGVHVFAPICHTHPIAMAGALPLGWEYWAEYDRRMIEACDELHVLCLEGWNRSTGVKAEIALALGMGKPVMLLDETTMRVLEELREVIT